MQSTLHPFNVEHKTSSNRARSTSAACESNILSTVLSKIGEKGNVYSKANLPTQVTYRNLSRIYSENMMIYKLM